MTDRSPSLRAVRIVDNCPVCTKEMVAAYRPFCSKRCADIDLGRWFKESYRIPTDEGPMDEEEGARDPSRQEG
jgi:hypothetical protein